MKNRVAIYARLSKEDLDKGENVSESIRNQESMLLSYANDRGWEIYDIYCDEDYSGVYAGDDNTRPDFNRMIEAASKQRFDIVLCKSQSRFSRNMEVIEQFIHGRFVEWGIRFVSVVDNADTEVKGNKKSRQISGMVNEWMCEDTSDNIRGVFNHKMRQGEFLAAFPPYGYSKDPRVRNHLIINPNTAPIVKRIFEWHKEGYGAAKISRMLNDMKIPCPRKQQEIDGIRKTCIYAPGDIGKWSSTSVSDILHNQAYCGDVVQHTVEKVSYKSRKIRKIPIEKHIIVHDMHDPIISREMFEVTQERCTKRRKSTGTGKVHILSGKVFCHYCGKPMQKNNSKGGYEYLRCRDKYDYSSKDRCPTPNIRIDTILEALSMELIEKCKDIAIDSLDQKSVEQLLSNDNGENKLLGRELERLQKAKDRIERQRKNLYLDKLSEEISAAEFRSMNGELTHRNDELSKQIDEIEKKLCTKKNDTKKSEDIQKGLAVFLETRSIDREIIESLVDRIEFGEIEENTGLPILGITWAWE